MKSSTFTFADSDGVAAFVYRWIPDEGTPKGIVQISHGMQEHAGRYERFAEFLTKNGYAVYANDHRGHGKTAFGVDKQGQLGPGGWDHTVGLLKELTERIKTELPGIPVFLFGHSWGSLLSQNYIERWGGELKGVLLSGTTGSDPMVKLGVLLGKWRVRMHGAAAPGGVLEKISVGKLNGRFEPARTPRDWLSRDEDEVARYIADPYCGRPFPNGFFLNLAELLVHTWNPKREGQVPKQLPIYLFAGSMDPVGKFTKTVVLLADRYRRNGIRDVTCRFYADARHETLHETNRTEVMKDILAWLDSHVV
jgi:alpha-beta hydrolase superfamily lysophospholipase